MTFEERFWAKVDRSGDCWVWTGALARGGYGIAVIGTRTDPQRLSHAHRVAYELLIGAIPEGLELDHLCRNRGCVNPAHLEPVTHSENLRRGVARRVTCRKGHDYEPGSRVCRICARTTRRARYLRDVAA